MNRYFLLLLVTIGFFIGNTLSAQTLSTTEFKEFVPVSLQKIAIKIHQAIKKGDLVVYADDKLNREIALDAYKLMGSEEVVIAMMNPANPNDPTDLIDTTAFMLLVDDELIPDLSFSYAINTDRKGRQIRTVQALAPTFRKNLDLGTKITYYHKPTGWVPLKSLKKILTTEERELINCYSWFKLMEPPQQLRREADTTTGLNELIDYTISENRLTLSGCEMAKNLGNTLHDRLRYSLFEAYKTGAFVLQAKDSVIAAKAFLREFSHVEALAMQNPLSDDPGDLIDTLLAVEPIAFDELSFEKRGTKTVVIITQKLNISGIYTVVAKYSVPFNQVKAWFHPMELKLLDLALKSKSKWEFK
jgi:hypothetical protein